MEKIRKLNEIIDSIVDDIQFNSKDYIECIDKLSEIKDAATQELIYTRLHERMVQEKPTVKSRLTK